MTDSSPELSDTPWPVGGRVALGVGYHGGAFSGWQAQPHLTVQTVQETLEGALSQIANRPVATVCAGRTDTKVHGVGQVVHFDDPRGRSAKAWVMGTNSQLPPSVRVHWAASVPADFHARFSATQRRYRYIIANMPILSPHLVGLVSHVRRPLSADLMAEAARPLLGEHDFSAFRAAQCQASHATREVFELEITRRGQFILVDIAANAFLYHMVRNIVGSLMMVGKGLRPVSWLGELLVAGDRTQAADTAAADGLYLTRVSYPDGFGLPAPPSAPEFGPGSAISPQVC